VGDGRSELFRMVQTHDMFDLDSGDLRMLYLVRFLIGGVNAIMDAFLARQLYYDQDHKENLT